jgi:hypothetical protein
MRVIEQESSQELHLYNDITLGEEKNNNNNNNNQNNK